MYAIVEIAGKQYKIEENKYVYTPKLSYEEGENITLENVLLTSNNDGEVFVGTPTTRATISAKVLEHVKADKVTVFKKKRRKGYKVKNGHRQEYTKLQIEKIN